MLLQRLRSRLEARGAPAILAVALCVASGSTRADDIAVVAVEGQPLASNVERLAKALEFLGAALPEAPAAALDDAIARRDAAEIQRLLDPRVLLAVTINPEERVKVARGPAPAVLRQEGYTPVVVKILNESTSPKRLRVTSPQAGTIVAGNTDLSAERQDQRELRASMVPGGAPGRFLDVELFDDPPMTDTLSGLEVEYALALVYSAEAGKREATLAFDIGQGTQDLGFRGELPVLFDVEPAIPATLRIRDHDGRPTTARLTFRDRNGHVLPPQPKRVAPDLFFQEQIYRRDGDVVLLPPGPLTMESSRGPEYVRNEAEVTIPEEGGATLDVDLERWIDPSAYGYYSGDHHIHGAGCAHYTDPTQGVNPEDMFLQVKGEGLNVGCVLTWGPCYDFQRQFFSAESHGLSEPFTVLKYDVEVSGFGSQALGHVCLLNLRDQTYPGSEGTSTRGWPSWTGPVLKWAKEQGGVTGYAHSASGLQVDPRAAAGRLLAAHDADEDGALTPDEAAGALLPEAFETIDGDRDGVVVLAELAASHDRAADVLPNLAIPEMNGVGAMEIPVTAVLGLCDFISAMDTPRIAEWNMWYHLLNCGLPIAVSGETDYPCMSGTRVGQGRVYVQLGAVDAVDFDAWCANLAAGRSYVSDGYAHALEFTVGGEPSGGRVALDQPGEVSVRAKVAFAPRTPLAVAHGSVEPAGGRRLVGDTVNLHGPRLEHHLTPEGEPRRVEIVVNGRVVDAREIPADGQPHDLEFTIPVESSSWVALRHFPQLHTNPVRVLVADRPIRASRESALWCLGAIEQLRRARGRNIAIEEREAARSAYEEAIAYYRQIAAEAR